MAIKREQNTTHVILITLCCTKWTKYKGYIWYILYNWWLSELRVRNDWNGINVVEY
jgi:hypothetical protein